MVDRRPLRCASGGWPAQLSLLHGNLPLCIFPFLTGQGVVIHSAIELCLLESKSVPFPEKVVFNLGIRDMPLEAISCLACLEQIQANGTGIPTIFSSVSSFVASIAGLLARVAAFVSRVATQKTAPACCAAVQQLV